MCRLDKHSFRFQRTRIHTRIAVCNIFGYYWFNGLRRCFPVVSASISCISSVGRDRQTHTRTHAHTTHWGRDTVDRILKATFFFCITHFFFFFLIFPSFPCFRQPRYALCLTVTRRLSVVYVYIYIYCLFSRVLNQLGHVFLPNA